MTLDWSQLGQFFTSVNLQNVGYEALPIAFSILLALMFTEKKKHYGLSFTFTYLSTFLIGWAKELWLLVVLALLAGIYTISVRDNND